MQFFSDSSPFAFPLRRKIMRLGIGELLVKPPGGFPAQGRVRLHHVKGVHIGVVHVHAGGNPAFLQVLDIPHSLGIERLPIPHEGIGRRKAGKVRQSGGSGVGRQAVPLLPPQITAPAKPVAPGVPHLAVVIPGGPRVPVVQHGVEGHLKGDVHRAGIRRRPAGMVVFCTRISGSGLMDNMVFS